MPDKGKGMLRRDFLAKGLSAAAVATTAGFVTSCDSIGVKAPWGKGKPTRLGFTTYTWGMRWDIPTLISNCSKAQIYGMELRTSQNYAHGVELESSAEQRQEAKKLFADSPMTLVGIACGERFDSPNPQEVKEAIENAKGYIKLSHDIGASGVRVFPNDFHEDVLREKTIAQIAKAIDEVGAYAANYGQQVRLEAHGSAGELPSIRAIMDQVNQKNVRVKLNSSSRDASGEGFKHNFNLVKDFQGDTLHLHNLKDSGFPYQLQMDLLVNMGWDGWQLLELSHKVPDRVAALIEQRMIWERMRDKALQA